MMRMGLIVVGLSTLTILELGTPSRTKTSAPDPFDQLMIDASVSPDTLETADRLETHHLPHQAPLRPPPAIPTVPPDLVTLVPREPGTVGLGANDNMPKLFHESVGQDARARLQVRILLGAHVLKDYR